MAISSADSKVVDQHEVAEHFSYPHGSLSAIGDSSVACSFGMEPKEVGVVGHQNASSGSGEEELGHIISAKQSGFAGGSYIDTPSAQAIGYTFRDVLVKMKANPQRFARKLIHGVLLSHTKISGRLGAAGDVAL